MDLKFRLVPGGFVTMDGRYHPSISGAEDNPDGGAGDGGQQLDIAALLADESKADTPVTIADLKPFLETLKGTVASTTLEQYRAQREQEDAQRRAADETNATRASDKNWALDLDKRLDSADPEVRQAALTEKQANNERYIRGMAISYEDTSTETMVKAVNAHMQPRLEHLARNGEQAFIDALADPNFVAQHGGNELMAAIKFGDERGYQRGLHEAEEEADRVRRAAEASEGDHGSGGGAGGGGDRNADLWEGIDRKAPGAAAKYQQRLRERETQQQRR